MTVNEVEYKSTRASIYVKVSEGAGPGLFNEFLELHNPFPSYSATLFPSPPFLSSILPIFRLFPFFYLFPFPSPFLSFPLPEVPPLNVAKGLGHRCKHPSGSGQSQVTKRLVPCCASLAKKKSAWR